MSKQVVNYQVISKLLSYDYPSALEKIGFTVAGILIALFINRCDETWKKRDLEVKSLQEIHDALGVDLIDIEKTAHWDTSQTRYIQNALNFMDGKLVNRDSLPIYFKHSFFYSFLLANTAAYETLKSRGLDLVQNDSLRLSIAYLYDVTYDFQNKVDQINNAMYMEHISPVRFRYFTKNVVTKLPYDVDFEEVRRDKNVKLALKLSYELYYKNKNEYEHLEQEVKRLRAAITKELSRH